MGIPPRGGGGKASRAANEVRVERATSETTLSIASASVGVLREPQSWRAAFTMAEILLSLTIIGVVAAITLPSLTGNINERTWNTQRKALYARFSQAISLMPALNGYGTLVEGNESTSAVDTATETFITDGLAKVLKINNICDSEHLGDCGITSKFIDLDNQTVSSFPATMVDFNTALNSDITEGNGITYSIRNKNTKAAAFETANGESILVYYNPNCKSYDLSGGYAQYQVCANFIYDLNGKKGPNTMGKDIGFISALYPTDTAVVAPMPSTKNLTGNASQVNGGKVCKNLGEDYRMPNREELTSMFFNRLLLGSIGGFFWSSTLGTNSSGTTTAYLFSFQVGYHSLLHSKENSQQIWCIKR